AAAAKPQYPRGTVALIPSTPGNFGSQFVIFHKDLTTAEPAYSIVGRVLGGLAVVDGLVKAGTVPHGPAPKAKPAKDVVVSNVRVDEARPAQSPAPSAPAGATPSATAQS